MKAALSDVSENHAEKSEVFARPEEVGWFVWGMSKGGET